MAPMRSEVLRFPLTASAFLAVIAMASVAGGSTALAEKGDPRPLVPELKQQKPAAGVETSIEAAAVSGKIGVVALTSPRKETVGSKRAQASRVPGKITPALEAAIRAFEEGNYTLAQVLFTDPGRVNSPISQFHLGLMYEYGLGIERDRVKAAQQYLLAAKAGHAKAAYNLGLMFSDGRGVTRDEDEAARWIGKAAERGLPVAQHALGVRYFGGNGVERNQVSAMMWFELAAAGGSQSGARSRDSLAKTLGREELVRARQMASLWRPARS